MATAKGAENEYIARKGEKISDGNTSSRRALKLKATEQKEGSLKKQKLTRAKSRTAVLDDALPAQSSLNKVREKGRAVVELTKIGDGTFFSKKEVENTASPKKDTETVGYPKKNVGGTVAPKKEGTGSSKKEVIGSVIAKKEAIGSGQSKKDGESIVSPKKDMQSLTVSKKDVEVISVKSRKLKVKVSNNVADKKRDDRLILSKTEENKSEVTTTEKSKSKDDKLKADKKETATTSKVDNGKNREIMNSDVTSSIDEKPPRAVRNQSPAAIAIANLTKECVWIPGDLAWGRVGQHPFWPCIIALDHGTGIYTKIKRVGRGLNAMQESLHVQFFGDNGRHSWIPNTCVIKYEGKDRFQKFAEKVLQEMKKKDKKYLSAFVVKPTSRVKWEVAIREAEESVPKDREARIQFFVDLVPKRKRTQKATTVTSEQKNTTNVTKSSVQLVKKRNKRPSPIVDEKPAKQVKIIRQVVLKAEERKRKMENSVPNTPTRKKRGRNKSAKKQTGNTKK